MAWLEEDAGVFHVAFRVGKRRFKKSLKTKVASEAQGLMARLEENLRLVERGRLVIPADADVATFLLSDGKLNHAPEIEKTLTLSEVFQQYLASIPSGAMEANTLLTIAIHQRHLERLLGKTFRFSTLSTAHLQQYIQARSKEPGRRGNSLTATTIRKEIATLRAVWSWGTTRGLVSESFPNKGLKYPKGHDKPPFQTLKEIQRQIERGRLSKMEQEELWDCLFLTLPEIGMLLSHVQSHATQPFIYPMVATAAHTGARRSELIRSRLSDFDGNTLVIREKKRSKSKHTTRRVPISPFLKQVLKAWLDKHPGGTYTFCHVPSTPYSRNTRQESHPLTVHEATDHFRRTLADSKWSKVRGWHTLRHSFASNCALKGVDQRIINEWMGHQTEEMVRRYRHLFPDSQQQAIRSVFGE